MSTINRRGLLRAGTAATLGFGLGIGLKGAAWAQEDGTPVATSPGVDPGALNDLRGRLDGTLLLPGDADYEARSRPSNSRFRHTRPLAIAQVAHESDVVASLAWCQENGVPLVGRGGGHSYAGYSTTTGLLIDIGQLSAVVINKEARTALIGGGANRDYFSLTADGPLFLPGGTCLGVGAGGNFGINTSLTFELAEAPQDNVTFYRFDWRGADAAAAVFATFHTILQNAPPALNAVAQAQASVVGDVGPREAIDVFSRGQYIGPISELIDLVSPLLNAAKPTKATIQEMAFWDMQRMFVSEEADWHAYGDHSRYAAEPIPDSAISAMVDLLAACPSRTATANGSIWSLGWIGGDVVNSFGRTDTAYVHRDMLTLLRPTPVWENDDPDSVADDLIAWTEEVVAALAPHTPAESYQNFPNRIISDWQQEYYAENFPRLVEVKTTYDDGNLFHNPQSIPPARLA